MRGESSAYVRVVAFDCTHLPAMLGDSVGAAFCSATGAEKVSVMGVFGGTFCVPSAGVADRRENAPAAEASAAEPPDPAAPPLALFDGECVGEEPPRESPTATAATRTAA